MNAGAYRLDVRGIFAAQLVSVPHVVIWPARSVQLGQTVTHQGEALLIVAYITSLRSCCSTGSSWPRPTRCS